jgi:hypothetical protein
VNAEPQLDVRLGSVLPGDAQGGGAGGNPFCSFCRIADITCGYTIAGTLEAGDCDLGNGTYVDHMRSQRVDTVLLLEDQECLPPDPIAVNVDCEPGNHDFSCITVTLSPGTYFIFATSYEVGETGDYELEVVSHTGPATDHRAPRS